MLWLFVTLSMIGFGASLDNGLSITPPMGWMWGSFFCKPQCSGESCESSCVFGCGLNRSSCTSLHLPLGLQKVRYCIVFVIMFTKKSLRSWKWHNAKTSNYIDCSKRQLGGLHLRLRHSSKGRQIEGGGIRRGRL